MSNEFDRTEMVNAKWFMRNVIGYNDFNYFISLNCNYCVEIIDNSKQIEIGEHFSHDLTNDIFFPITPLSNQVYIEVEVNDRSEVYFERYNFSKYYARLGINIKSSRDRNIAKHIEPDWGYWARCDSWSPIEAAYLLFCEDPEHHNYEYIKFHYDDIAIRKLIDLIERAFQTGELEGFRNLNEIPSEIQIFTRKGNLGTWLKRMGFAVPEELKDTISEAETSSSEVTQTEEGPLQFKTPEGTTWRDIRLVIRNNDLTEWLEVNGPDGPCGNFKPEEIGFRGHIGPGHTWTFLKEFAKTNGILAPRGLEVVKPTVSRLRKALRALFPGIDGDPIPWRKSEKSWRTAFPIELKRYEEE